MPGSNSRPNVSEGYEVPTELPGSTGLQKANRCVLMVWFLGAIWYLLLNRDDILESIPRVFTTSRAQNAVSTSRGLALSTARSLCRQRSAWDVFASSIASLDCCLPQKASKGRNQANEFSGKNRSTEGTIPPRGITVFKSRHSPEIIRPRITLAPIQPADYRCCDTRR